MHPLRLSCVAAGVLVALAGCRPTDLTLWKPSPPAEAFTVETIRDVAYRGDKDDDGHRHQLDLFLPKGAKDYPVVFLIHGGAWIVGDNRCCGLYSSVGQYLASQGVGVVMPNYRLSPKVKHPEHIKDVARAFAWTKKNIGSYGGRADKIIIAGHSAGGHLAALMATDERYLKEVGCTGADIAGVIATCGVYNIPPGKLEVKLGGTDPDSFRFDMVGPLRGEDGQAAGPLAATKGMPLRINLFGLAFGNDPEARADASPVNHVRRGLPPFLIFSAERDLPTLPAMAAEFQEALLDKGCDARLVRVPDRNHSSLMFRAVSADDPVSREMLAFIRQVSAAPLQ